MTENLPVLPGSVGFGLGGIELKEARKKALQEAGMQGTRKKYGSKEERKKAQKVRSKERREQKKKFLAEKGLYAPRVKMSPEQKKLRRSLKAKMRRQATASWAKANPEEARQFGFNPDRMGLKKGSPKKEKKTKKKGK